MQELQLNLDGAHKGDCKMPVEIFIMAGGTTQASQAMA